ncbi:hypothetical protein IEQ34_007014 [Dendrobium chrysotoxum]|uniref:Uncharacterized protein n=1 Tax=Dendrobium chrysotoxum TaxID=161865 RepID=A0AAV7H9K3_DENCH|nr:hypothetical protein IEQ34_007014 [Dendrobium chrysotoxum]
MARSNSSEDCVSSPSASSSSSGDENLAITGTMQPTDPNPDPESPNAAHQSSDESGSSDGVLVELPSNNDQDSRSLPGDPDSGILVNIDGSMQEHQEREDLFVDASDSLGSGGRDPKLGESAAMVEVGEAIRRRRSREQDLERVQVLLDASSAECRKYKEEREAFGREVLTLRTELGHLINQQFLNSEELFEYHGRLYNREPEHGVLASPASLHAMVKDCSRFVVHLKGVFDERLNTDEAVLDIKDQEIEILNAKILEYDVFRDVLISHLGSVRGQYSQSMHEYINVIKSRLLASIPATTVTESVSSEELVDGISLIEKRTMLLVEKHNKLLHEVEQLCQFMEEMKPGCLATQENKLGLVFSVAREELLECKKKEEELEERIRTLKEENRKMDEQIIGLNEDKEEANAEMSKIKTELEQSESRLLAAKEKLSIAVTKGKQLVQHRDSLKQSLANKTTELDACVQELQQKADALGTMEARNEELKQLLSDKACELEKCLLELQDKSNILEESKATVEDQKQLLQEKTSELDKCLLELQLKSDAYNMANTNTEEVKQLLSENKDQLENCLLDLQQKSKDLEAAAANAEELKQSFNEKNCELEDCLLNLKQNSDALDTAVATVQQLKQALAEKDIELEKSLLELQEKTVLVTNTVTVSKELNETQNLVHSLQELVSSKDKALKDIEEITHDTDFPQDLLSLDIVDKVRWIVTKASISDEILQENRRAKNAFFSFGVPEAISSAELDSQVDWLVRSFTQSKDELSKLQSEVTHTWKLQSELSEALKEVDSLAESLLKEKEEKESLSIKHEDLKVSHEKLAENLALISSEKERFIEFLKEVTTTNLDEQPALDMDTMLEKSIVSLRQRIKISLNDGKKLESMQTLLHVAHVELTLFEKIVEELQMDGSKMRSLSDELGAALEEVCALKIEKESMQKDLERLEEKNSLIRDKLSMAVKKGKGLVQEREGFKLTLIEKNSEIEKLKEELQLQESKACEYREQIKSLSAYPEQVLKLEVDIASLKDKIEQSEHLFSESNGNLKKLVDSINDIAIHTDKIFEAPIEKVDWIAGRITETENSNAFLEQELEKVKADAALNSNRLAEALDTMKSLEMELLNKEKHIRDIYDDKNSIQASKAKVEEELEEAREESFLLANKLSDAYASMKSLEDTLLLAEDKVSALDSEKNKIVSESNLEISALNAKVFACMEELTKTQGNSEKQSAELLSELRKLQMFMKKEGLFPLMIEQFHKKAEGLRHMWMLVKDIHDNLVAKGPHIHPEMEEISVFANLSSLPSFEDFINNEVFYTEPILEDDGAVTSCKKIVEKIYEEARLLNDRFTGLSGFMDDHITFTLQALQSTKDEFMHTLYLSESLKLTIEKLETRNQAQEFEISSLQTDALRLLSVCKDATQELHVKVSDLLGFDLELENVHSGLDMRSPVSFQGKIEKEDASEFAQAADNLLLTCRKIIIQFQNLVKFDQDMSISLENLKHKLNHAEMTAETMIGERKLIQDRVLKLEGDIDELQNICNEMKVKLNDYQSKEDLIKDKEAELKRLEHSLTAKGRGAGDEMISKGQVEVLFDKVNKLIVLAGSSGQSESQNQEIYFSSPADKLFYVVDKFSEFQQGCYSLTREKENLQLIVANHVCEIENLKNSALSISTDYQDLQLKKLELSEVTSILEKIMQKLSGNYSFEDLKPVTAMGLIRVLERQMIALSVDLENSKSEVHELGGKLQAKDIIVNELSAKVKYLEDSHARIQQPDVKERTVFESSTSMMRPEITEIEEAGSVGMSSKPPAPASAHVRTTRKGSSEHLVLNIDSESEQLITSHETDDKGHVFKSLNTSGLIPKQGRVIADRVDGIWVSGGRILMSKPGARLGLIGYWIFLHLWLLGSILQSQAILLSFLFYYNLYSLFDSKNSNISNRVWFLIIKLNNIKLGVNDDRG